MLAFENLLKAAHRFFNRYVHARHTIERFRNVKRLRQEQLNTASADNDELVFFGQFVHTENRDDIQQLFVALQQSS